MTLAIVLHLPRFLTRSTPVSADMSARVQQFVDSRRTKAEAEKSRAELRRIYAAYQAARARSQAR